MIRDTFYCRWENRINRRYYVCWLEVDLLGDWLCTRCYGSLDSAQGQIKKQGVASWQTAQRQIKRIAQTRRRHGYNIVTCSDGFTQWMQESKFRSQLLKEVKK